MKNTIKLLGAVLLFVALASCTKETRTDYLYIDCTQYMFSSEEDSISIYVNSSLEWEPQVSEDWIRVDKISDDSLRIFVLENTAKEERSGKVSIVSGYGSSEFVAYQQGDAYTGKFVNLATYWYGSISKNGKYIVTMKKDDNSELFPILINTYTGEETQYLEHTSKYSGVCAVSNDGDMFLQSSKDGMSTEILKKDGTIVEISSIPEGYFSCPRITDLSSDGTVWVGYLQNQSTRAYDPVKWINGEPEILERPDVCIYGTPSYAGAMARGCSEDGSVIYGSDWSWMQHPLVYWKNGEMFYPGYEQSETKIIDQGFGDEEAVCAMTMDASSTNISPDGRYITSSYNDYIDNKPYDYVAVIDTETGEQILMDMNDTGLGSATGLSATNDGLIFGATPAGGVSAGYVFNVNDFSTVPIDDWFETNCGMNVSSDKMVLYVSGDKNIFFGYAPVDTGMGTTYKYWYFVVDRNKLPQE